MEIEFVDLRSIPFKRLEEIACGSSLSATTFPVEKDIGRYFIIDDRLESGMISLEFLVPTDEFVGCPLLEKCLPLLEDR